MIPRPAQFVGYPGGTHTPRDRSAPLPGALARRRTLITFTKYLLPLGAVALLTMVALWPDLDRHKDNTRFSFSNVTGEVEGARLTHARYHGVNEKGQPYTLTTDSARQLDTERVALTKLQGDIVQQNGQWINLKAEHGIFLQRANALDLWRAVELYRDDGTTLSTASATLDIKNGTAVGGEPVHAEGPFGTLDAQGFTIMDKGTAIQFTGPARVLLNAASP